MKVFTDNVPTFQIEQLDGMRGQIQVGSDECDGVKTVSVVLITEDGNAYVIDIKSYDIETGEEI